MMSASGCRSSMSVSWRSERRLASSWMNIDSSGPLSLPLSSARLCICASVVVAWASVLCAAAADAQDRAPIKVYAFTAQDPNGFVDKVAKKRIETLDDLKKRLAKNKALDAILSDSVTNSGLFSRERRNDLY